MLQARKKLRLRRPSSPCVVQYAFQEMLQTLKGLIAYRWWFRYERRGIPRLHVVVLLGLFVTADQILGQMREFCDYEEVGVVVMLSTDAFVSICAADYDNDDDDDDTDADDDADVVDDVVVVVVDDDDDEEDYDDVDDVDDG
jgi:hypothetical protein